jgi:hypothetical protein
MDKMDHLMAEKNDNNNKDSQKWKVHKKYLKNCVLYNLTHRYSCEIKKSRANTIETIE